MDRGEVERLVERFGGIVAEGARFTIEPGEAFPLLGPTSAGKSTICTAVPLLPLAS